jgi:vitamin B12 transporter
VSWLVLILFCLHALSHEMLEPIEVSSEKDVELFTLSGQEKITKRQLEAQPLLMISSEIEKVPGIISNQNGGPGGRVSYFIRGTESRHVSFTLDGLKINDASNTDRQFDAAFFTAPMLKQVNIYPGPQAVLYGSDAMGGLIELISRKGEDAPESRLTLNAGSFGTVGTTLARDWSNETSHGTFVATRFHSDGISRLNKKRFRASEKDATDITQVSSSSEHRWTHKLQTDFLLSYLHGNAEQDGFDTDNSNDFSKNDQFIVQQKTSYDLAKNQSLSLRTGMNRHQRQNQSLVARKEFFNGTLSQYELTHRIDLGPLTTLSGVSVEHESAKAIELDKSFDLHSIFTQSSFKKGDWRIQGGGRVDDHSRYGTFMTGAGGVSWKEFAFQYSQGFKAPSIYQLYGPPSAGSPVGNPHLIPESNHYSELSWKRKMEPYEVGITLFQNRLSNLFTYSFTEGYINQQRFIAEGVEVVARYKGLTTELFGSFTHQSFREVEASVLRRPYNSLQGGISFYPVETLELNILSRWFSSRKDFPGKLNSYEVFDAGVRKRWSKDDVSLQLRNLLNRDYEELYGFSVLPRSLFANYSHRF